MVLVFIVLSTVRSPIRMFRSFAWPIDIVSLIIFLSLNQIRSSHYVRIRVSRKKHTRSAARFSCGPKRYRLSLSFDSFKIRLAFSLRAHSNNGTHCVPCIIIRFRLLIKCTSAGRFLSPPFFLLSIVVLVTCNQARDHTIFLHGRQFIIFNSCYCFHSNQLPAKYAPLVSGKWCKKNNHNTAYYSSHLVFIQWE